MWLLEHGVALVLAVDRQILADKVAQFGEQPSYALVPPGIDGYVPFSPEYADWTQEERNHEARRLYEQAGYSEERPLRIEIRYNTSENHKKMALAVASMWKQVLGVNTTLVNEEFRVFLQNRAQKVVTQVFSSIVKKHKRDRSNKESCSDEKDLTSFSNNIVTIFK